MPDHVLTIISHSRRFIYIKARKVASSSLLVALGAHCSPDDIVTAPGDTEGFERRERNSAGLKTHTAPADLRRIVTPEQWRSYTKIACVRNPWDGVISALFWRAHRRHKRQAPTYSEGFLQALAALTIDVADPEYRRHLLDAVDLARRNETFYFSDDGQAEADVYLRYENLQGDYDALCARLGMPTTTLPVLKGNARPQRLDYRPFYDDILRQTVAEAAPRTIAHFGYAF